MSGYTERKQFMLHKAEKKTWDPDAKAIKSHPKTFEPPIPVLLPSNLTESQLLDFVPFGNWLVNYTNNLDRQKTSDHTFHEHPYKLREIEVQAADWFKQENKPDRLGFIKLQHSCHTEPYINEEGKQAKDWLTGCAFLRGASVAILVSNSS
jgi:ADP-sugar diphosphatase